MTTILREARILDLVGVIAEMSETDRGVAELQQAIALGGPESLDGLALDLMTRSRAAFAMVDEVAPGRALSVAGFIPVHDGVLRTWMLTPDATWDGHALELTTHTAEGMKHALESAHRIETYCLDSHERAQRWYARIGLHKEATLKSFGTDGQDVALFVMTRGKT